MQDQEPILVTVERELEANRMVTKFPYKRLVYWLISVVIFFCVSLFSIVAALGYRINFEDRTLVQTGLIILDGPIRGLPVTVTVNGKAQATQLPYRWNWILPGRYEIELSRTGYQKWERIIQVRPNAREIYSPLFMIFEKPKPLADLHINPRDPRFERADTDGIEIRGGSELYVAGKFITRMSDDILSARWYLKDTYVAMQVGNQILLIDIENGSTQRLLALPSGKAANYFFMENGRVLAYRLSSEDGTTEQAAVELYEPTSFIDRWVAGL